MITLILAFIPLISSYHIAHNLSPLEATVKCSAYQCAPSSYPMPTNYCIQSNSGIFYLKPCTSSGQYCNTATGQCSLSPSTNSTKSYPGESCTSSSDCLYGNCISKVCKGLSAGGACLTSDQCQPGLFCNTTNMCQTQLAAGASGCRNSYDCVNYASCNKTYSTNNGVCVKYASLGYGSVVTDCTGGFSQMCSSAYCSNNNWMGTIGICLKPPASVNSLPYNCTSSVQCQGFNGTNIFLSQCQCAYGTTQASYCQPFIGDILGTKLINWWVYASKKSNGKCNTVTRGSDTCLKKLNLYTDITEATWQYYNYSQILYNDACVKEIYTAQYWGLSHSKLIELTMLIILII
ncbi:unnamed protein product [Blepharisma stoltei]|uniref:Uncharacterized protein n=1 Tax=Blepharisma stoltei TaxID=1481888 RepID=A0AAU9ICT6_9CILI|nr:unnamed protein product [Blepharisma stoltei]